MPKSRTLDEALKRQAATAARDGIGSLKDRELIDALEARGFLITRDTRTERVVEITPSEAKRVRFAVVTDTHLGSRYQQLTHWREFARRAEAFGAEFCLHLGDVVDGSQMRKGHEYEVFKHGADAQASYVIEAMPALKSGTTTLPTYCIGGNHDEDFWKAAGANILRTVADSRPDIHFLGAPAALFHIGPLRIYMLHPRGGLSYARSYRLQKIVEQFAPDEKPHILLCGHYHVAIHVPGYRNVDAFIVPCFQSQTPFLKALGLAPVVGGLLLEARYSPRGLEGLTTEWVIFHKHLAKDWP